MPSYELFLSKLTKRTLGQKFTIDEFRTHLFSNDFKNFEKAASWVKESGTSECIPILLDFFSICEQEEQLIEVRDMLMAMRLPGAEEALIHALKQSHLKNIHKDVLEFMWSNGFAGVGHLGKLVQRAIELKLNGMIELLSIMEQEGEYTDEDQLESLTFVQSLDSSSFNREEKLLLKEIHERLLRLRGFEE